MKNRLLEKPAFWAAVIFLTAAYLRLFRLDLIEFKFDEAFTVFQMTNFYAHPYLPQTGPPQSTGVYNPPLFNFLMIFISVVSKSPQFLSFVIAFINTIFVAVFYLVIRKFYGNITAVFTAFLIALSPWGIIFSRKIWIPDLIFPFMVVFLYFFLQLTTRKSTKAILPLFVILALLVQMHASGLFFTVATILVLIILREKVSWKQALKGFCLGLIPAIPYFIRELSSTPFCTDCVAFWSYQAVPKSFDFNVFVRPLQLTGGLNFEALLGNDYKSFLAGSGFLRIVNSLFLSQIVIFLAGVILIVGRERKQLFLLLYPILVTALYFLTRTPSYMHYFAILVPLIALLGGWSFGFVWSQSKSKWTKASTCLVFVAVIVTNAVFVYSFNNFLFAKQIINGDYGPVFPVTEKLINESLAGYLMLPNYPEVKSYAYMFAHSPQLHSRLGEYFVQTNNPAAAENEYKKALQVNQKDTLSRANLIYIDIMTGKLDEAKSELDILLVQDSTLSAKLKSLLDSKQN